MTYHEKSILIHWSLIIIGLGGFWTGVVGLFLKNVLLIWFFALPVIVLIIVAIAIKKWSKSQD